MIHSFDTGSSCAGPICQLRRVALLAPAILCGVLTSWTGTGTAATPPVLNFQAYMTDSGTPPVPLNGPHTIEFGVWDDPVAPDLVHRLWFESLSVTITRGEVDVLLGQFSPMDHTLFDDPNRWLDVHVVGFGTLPRIQMASTPYSFRGATLDGTEGGTVSGDVTLVGSLDATGLKVTGTAEVDGLKMATGATTGYVLTSDGTGMASWQAPSVGGMPLQVSDQLEIVDGLQPTILLDAHDGVNGSLGVFRTGDLPGIELDSQIAAPNAGAELRLYNPLFPANVRTFLGAGDDSYGGYLYLDRGEGRLVQIDITPASFPSGRLWLRAGTATAEQGFRVIADVATANHSPVMTMWSADGTVETFEVLGSASGSNDGSVLRMRDHSAQNTVVLEGEAGDGGGSLALRNRNGNLTVLLESDRDADPAQPGFFLYDDNLGSSTVRAVAHEDDSFGGGLIVLSDQAGRETVTIDGRQGVEGGGAIQLANDLGSETLLLDGDSALNPGNSRIMMQSGGLPTVDITSNDGRVKTCILEITGGCDLSERFKVTHSAGIEPGTVLAIDEHRPGQLTICSTAYDRKVAGILSGANGISTGMLMGQTGHVYEGEHPVALSGRVYVKAETSRGLIRPGDLLTSSDRPGYAMRADDPVRSQGAIIGKAMTPLLERDGYVLVLVGLQ